MSIYSLYKLSRKLYLAKVPLLPKIIKGAIYFFHNSIIPYEAEIGTDCKFLYQGIGTVIHKEAVIGNNVMIGTNVLIGGRSNKEGAPKIGNNVYISTGAKVLGPITIHDNVIIGANAVVIHDVKSNCSVGGVPAKVLKENIDVRDFCSIGKYGTFVEEKI